MEEGQYFVDATLVCVDCGRSFQWTCGEQSYFFSKGLRPPKRCLECREPRRRTLRKSPEVSG
ncbi:MAG: zinc-ribbon domain containing protein [Dehalococcoidia bacterium]|nr:zinc-ribbon domain containing protein [Dehalococcoidia bacterium]